MVAQLTVAAKIFDKITGSLQYFQVGFATKTPDHPQGEIVMKVEAVPISGELFLLQGPLEQYVASASLPIEEA